MTRQEVAYFWVPNSIIAHVVFFLHNVRYFFFIETHFASEMEIDIMSFSQQGKIQCVSIIVQIHNMLLTWKMESKLVHYSVTIIAAIFEKFLFTFLTGLIIFGRFLTGPKQIENRRKEGIKNPRNYDENFWI